MANNFDGFEYSDDDIIPQQHNNVEASIVIEDIQPDGYSAAYIPEDSAITVYTDYMIHNRFEKDRHICMLPVASPDGFNGNLAAFVQLASPTLLWIADWTACKFGESPEIPAPDESDPNWVLMDEHIEPSMLTLDGTGEVPLYRISGVYVYGKLNPSVTTVDDCGYPRPPWMENIFPRDVPEDTLIDDLL